MNKLTKLLNKFFKSIARFFDKKLILPITKFFVNISNKFKGNGRSFEKIITRKPGLIIISLLVALGVFILADTRSTSLIETSAEVLYDQPISATYNEEAYVVQGLPKTVDITLVGRKSDVYLAKQLPTNDITIDLTGLSPGVHKVNLRYKKALSSVEYKLDPSVATIVIYEKVSEKKEINYEVINKDKLSSKLYVSGATLSSESAYVKGDEATLKKVAYVKALIDLNELSNTKSEDELVGKQKIENVKLIAYDNNAKKVNVEVVPNKVIATVNITKPSKEVPVKLIPKGEVVFGKAISSLTSDVSNVTIYGKASKLDKVSYIPVYVDVDNLKDNKQYSVKLTKPNGIRSMSNNTINVNVTLSDETTKEFNDIYLEYENLGDGLSVQAADANSTKVTVSVSGTSNVLNDLDPTSIKAYVDLKDIGEGEHSIEVKVKGTDLRAKYTSMTKKVTLRITKK